MQTITIDDFMQALARGGQDVDAGRIALAKGEAFFRANQFCLHTHSRATFEIGRSLGMVQAVQIIVDLLRSRGVLQITDQEATLLKDVQVSVLNLPKVKKPEVSG